MINVKAALHEALAADPYQDALAQLAGDRFGKKIAAAERAELTTAALKIGVKLAEKLLRDHSLEIETTQDLAPQADTEESFAADLEISREPQASTSGNNQKWQPLLDTAALAIRLGALVTEAEYPIAPEFTTIGYFETPNEIFINRYFARYDAQLAAAKMPLLRYDSWRSVVITHELFHYLDETQKVVPLQEYRLKLWKLGPYTHQTELPILREISAMAFAQRLTGWPFYPGRLSEMLLKLTQLDSDLPQN